MATVRRPAREWGGEHGHWRKPRGIAVTLSLAAALAAPLAARADLPLVTESGDVAAQGTCKVESAYQQNRESRAGLVLASCNPFGFGELAAGYARVRDGDAPWTNDVALQAKFPLLEQADERPWALALAVGAVRHTAEPSARTAFQDPFLTVPATLFFYDGALLVHLNAGVARADGSNVFTTAAAAEAQLAERLTLLAEVFRAQAGRPTFNGGVLWTLIPDQFHVYASAAHRLGGDSAGWSWLAGIRLEAPDAARVRRRRLSGAAAAQVPPTPPR